mmetsp:Transcript_85184/g.135019  ORF Transcript_85184/g.135019 Transcript_85184/m.135019 type:complete len:82 (+) Transcript_85184:85-330(+)
MFLGVTQLAFVAHFLVILQWGVPKLPKPPGVVRLKRSVDNREVPSAMVGGGQRWLRGKLRVVITPQGGFNMVVVPSCGTTP